MKTKLYLFILSLGFFFWAPQLQAQCQLCYLKKDQAERVVKYLSSKKEMIFYAGCANRDIARRVLITEVNFRPTVDRDDYYEIYVRGNTVGTFYIEEQKPVNYAETNMKFERVVDIAYVHVRTGGFVDDLSGQNVWDATCLGIYLGFDCDPCVDPFDYPLNNSR